MNVFFIAKVKKKIQSGDKSFKWARSFKIEILQDHSFETQFTLKSTDNKTCICDIFTLVENV